MRNRYKITRKINKNTDRMALSFYAVKNFMDIYIGHIVPTFLRGYNVSFLFE